MALTEPLHHLYMFSLSLRYALENPQSCTCSQSWQSNLSKELPPHSLLSNTSKVLERIIYKTTLVRTSIHVSLASPKTTADINLLIISSPLQTDVIYFDISKAFDTVSHSILLNKLWSIGIAGTLWSWFKDYLSNCYQKVIILLTTLTLIHCL